MWLFLLWKAQNPNKEGTPLPGAKKVDYLIIDGQQRIRNLYSIFRDIDSASGEDEEEDGNDEKAKKVWCVNIASLPELSKKIEENKRYRLLFHRITEPGQGSKMVYNMVPLKKVLKSSDLSDLYTQYIKADSPDDVLSTIRSIGLTEKIKKMLDHKFPIIILDEDQKSHNSPMLLKYITEYGYAKKHGLKRKYYGGAW